LAKTKSFSGYLRHNISLVCYKKFTSIYVYFLVILNQLSKALLPFLVFKHKPLFKNLGFQVNAVLSIHQRNVSWVSTKILSNANVFSLDNSNNA